MFRPLRFMWPLERRILLGARSGGVHALHPDKISVKLPFWGRLDFPGPTFHLDLMLTFNQNLFVRIQEVEGTRAPVPRPLENGFSVNLLYRVLGIYTPSETAEAYFILPNDRDEIWFISQRHVRFGVLKEGETHHLPLNWTEFLDGPEEKPVSR